MQMSYFYVSDFPFKNFCKLTWLSSQARLSSLVLLPGCDEGTTSFLPRLQCLQFQSNTFIFAVIAFSLIAIKLPDTDF